MRHGESVGNAGERTREPGTYSLTARGFGQAAVLAAWMNRRPSLFVTSPYTRAQQTFAPTAERHPGVPREEWPVQEITYLAPVRCVNTTQNERREMARDFWEDLDPDFIDGEGAESFAQFMARARSSLDRLRTLDQPFTILFSHAIFMRGVLWCALNRPARIDREAMQLFHHFSLSLDVPNCAVMPMLLAEDGTVFTGAIADPTGTATPATAEEIRLSGL